MSAADYATGQGVHFVCSAGRHRAALITRMWPHRTSTGGQANLTIFLDDERDEQDMQHLQESPTGSGPMLEIKSLAPLIWRVTGASQDEEAHQVGTWHWPETPTP